MGTKFGEVILQTCPNQSPIESIACFSDSQKLIVGQAATDGETPTLSIININTGDIEKVIERSDNYKNAIWHLVIDRNDNYIIYLKQVKDKFQIIRYNIKTEEKKMVMEADNYDKYKGFVISPHNEFVIGIDHDIKFIDIEGCQIVKSIRIKKSRALMDDPHCYTSLAFSPGGNLLAIGGLNEGKVILYDLQKEKVIKQLSAKFEYPRSIAFDPSGKYTFILDYWTHGMFIWNLQSNNWHMEDIFSENWDGITCVDFDKMNPKNVIMGTLHSVVLIMDFEVPEEIFSDEIHKGRIYDVLVTPDGKKLVSSGEDWQIVVRNAE